MDWPAASGFRGAITYARRSRRVQLYRELIRIAEATLAYLAEAARRLRAYVWSSVVAYNLVLFARLKPA